MKNIFFSNFQYLNNLQCCSITYTVLYFKKLSPGPFHCPHPSPTPPSPALPKITDRKAAAAYLFQSTWNRPNIQDLITWRGSEIRQLTPHVSCLSKYNSLGELLSSAAPVALWWASMRANSRRALMYKCTMCSRDKRPHCWSRLCRGLPPRNPTTFIGDCDSSSYTFIIWFIQKVTNVNGMKSSSRVMLMTVLI